MKKKLIAGMITGVMLLSAVGCTNTSNTGDMSGEADKTAVIEKADTANPENNSDSGKIQIRFANWDGGDALKAYQEICDSFNASQDKIEVTILNIPEEYSTKITTMAAAGDIPEFCMLDANEILFPLAEQGYIKNMKELIENDPGYDESDMVDTLKAWNGEDFMVGYGAGAQNICMFYNPELFEKYGVDMPPATYADAWDWETFVENAQKLTIDKNGNNALSAEFDPENIDTYGVSANFWWAAWMPFVISADGNYLTEDGSSFGMNSPEAVNAMQKLSDLINVYHVMPKPSASESLKNTSSALATGKVAMVIDGQWTNNTLMADSLKYDVAALPKIGEKAATIVTYGVLCVMDTSKADAAWEFFKYISKCGAAEPLEKSGLWLPTTKTGFSEDYMKSVMTPQHPEHYYDAIVKPMLDGTAQPMTSAAVKNFAKINDLFNPVLDKVWNGDSNYEDAVNSVYEDCNKFVEGWNY
ncbi:MAG: sugar ABC transporter substrate-binding protein [Eubacteriales bacterium]|nr:sugar ABC transporter substrate-binding protein [Eubacteriales bacterium]